ncbi:MAG: diguanylate cyclase, partial [Synergistaceae bacterium]
ARHDVGSSIPDISVDSGDRKAMLVYDGVGEDLNFCRRLFKDRFDVVGANSMEDVLGALVSLNENIAVLIVNFEEILNIGQVEELYHACKGHNIPAIIISDKLNALMTEALHMGISDYLLRPYNDEGLCHRTENVISRARITQFQRESEINAAILEMKKRAEEDPLTKLLNRVEFESRVSLFFMNNKRPHGVFVMCDVDNFKQINDTFGHVMGDKVLCHMADVLRSIFTETELISRIGGDEYALFIPFELDESYLAGKLARLHASLDMDKEHIRVSCSAGVSFCP